MIQELSDNNKELLTAILAGKTLQTSILGSANSLAVIRWHDISAMEALNCIVNKTVVRVKRTKTLTFIKPKYLTTPFRWDEDVFRIVDICHQKGYQISLTDAQEAWEQHSDDLAAGWLSLGDNDDEIFNTVMEYCNTEESQHDSR